MTGAQDYFVHLGNLLNSEELKHYRLSLKENPTRAGWRLPWKRMAPHLREFPALSPHKDSFLLPAAFQPGKDPAWHAGIYYCQEPSALNSIQELLVHSSLPSTFSRVLDLCSAPGGKTLLLRTVLEDGGVLISNEVDSRRVRILRENIERAGILEVLTCSQSPQALARDLQGWAELVWVDAPCSGEALFRRNPELLEEWNFKEVQSCASRQEKILLSALEILQEGGILIYSTCTFNTIENEKVIHRTLEAAPDLELVSTRRFWPHRQEGEGQFVAILRKRGGGYLSPVTKRAKKISFEKGKASSLTPFLSALPPGQVSVSGDKIFYIPRSHQQMEWTGFRRGILVGRIKRGKKRLEIPAHALAMLLEHSNQFPSWEVSEEQASDFLRGRELNIENMDSGWVLITIHHQGLGWGKVVGSRVKNHYPSAFRIRE